MIGLSPELVEGLSLKEINIYFDSLAKKRQDELNMKLRENYELAKLTAHFVNCSLAGKQIPEFNSIYKNQPTNKVDEAKKVSMQVDMWKEYAAKVNKERQSDKETQQ